MALHEAIVGQQPARQDADHVFYELTRSICPECQRPIDAQIVLRDGKVFMRKRCPTHGRFEALVYGDAQAYTSQARFNKPGTIPLAFNSRIEHGCPHDCGLCPDHQQHACLGIIEINSACDMQCPLCFADAGQGFSLTLEEVEDILDGFVRTEGYPEVVQFSGGEPTIHPEIAPMLRAAKARHIRHVMLNTNGKRIANDDAFLSELAEIKPAIYFQFDGFLRETYRVVRGEPDILDEKLKAMDRLAEIGCEVVLAPAVERAVNEQEIGDIVRFGMRHPAVLGINFQPAFHAGRFMQHDPLQRMTIPDILRLIEAQTDGMFRVSDFVPVPCCFPTCNSVTYAYVDGDRVLPITRLLDVEDYLDYLSNRILPGFGDDVLRALEGLWSSSAVPGSAKATSDLLTSCAACQLPEGLDVPGVAERMFMVMLQDFMDPWTFNQKNVMKCCKEFLLPGGKQIPFSAYNSVGYREQARAQLAARQRERLRAEQSGLTHTLEPITFHFGGGGVTSESIKACCADLYASDRARLVLGDSFHPGGLELTQRLGVLLGLGSESRVLELASGRGVSALHLARHFGCQVVGVDYSTANVSAAREAAERDGLTIRLHFQDGDAERLADFEDASFDAVLCECAFCTFPDKPAAMREIARVLRPGGRFGLSDLVRRGPLPAELQGLLAWIACIGDALPIEGYVAECEAAGLVIEQVEEDDDALAELVREIRGRLLGAHLLVSLKQLELPEIDWPRVTGMARRAERAVEDGTLGYALMIATKPWATCHRSSSYKSRALSDR